MYVYVMNVCKRLRVYAITAWPIPRRPSIKDVGNFFGFLTPPLPKVGSFLVWTIHQHF